jgi:NADPH:quinone reductase-like Zn-dependent oxidoreductase
MDALLIERGEPAVFTTVDDDRLPAGDVTVRVTHSSLNYKDALAITASAPVVRAFPMVPGIDLAGVIEHSTDARWRAGDTVLVNGFGLGELHWGGLAQRASLDGGRRRLADGRHHWELIGLDALDRRPAAAAGDFQRPVLRRQHQVDALIRQ